MPRAAVTLFTNDDPPAVVAFTCATTVNVALAPDARLGIVQFGLVNVPADGVALIKVMPAGKLSVSATLVPAIGPALRTVTENVTFVPFAAELTFAVFVVIRFRSSSMIVDIMLVRPTDPQAEVLANAYPVPAPTVISTVSLPSISWSPISKTPVGKDWLL